MELPVFCFQYLHHEIHAVSVGDAESFELVDLPYVLQNESAFDVVNVPKVLSEHLQGLPVEVQALCEVSFPQIDLSQVLKD